METGDSLVGASLTSKFQTTMMFPGVSSAVFDVYVEYVPRPVPQAPRSVGKRGQADCSSSGPMVNDRWEKNPMTVDEL